MFNAPRGDYQSISVMDGRIAHGNKFFVEVAGTTNGAHRKIVSDVKKQGYVEVLSREDSDFLLIFCPVVSRVGTDIGEALQNVHVNKAKVLVVMHHTFNERMAVAESRRQVEDRSVELTVDCLFYEGNLLDCERNDHAWDQICKYLPQVPAPQSSYSDGAKNWFRRNRVKVLCVLGFSAIIIIIILGVSGSQTKTPMNESSKYPLK